MKRTIIILSLLAAVCGGLQAQTKDSIDTTVFTAGYDFKVNTKDKEGNAVTDSVRTVLLVGNKVTKTIGYYTDMIERKGEERGSYGGKRLERMAHVPTIFVWREEDQMTVVEDVPAHRYQYTEPADMMWTVWSEDTMTVSGYLCHKAKTEYGGRTWTAWYTEDVPSTAGPWKLHGTPGLIVKAEDGDGIFCFSLFELTQVSRPITLFDGVSKDSSLGGALVKTKRDKLIKQRNKLFTDPRYLDDPLYYYIQSPSDRSGGDVFSGDIQKGVPIPFDSFYRVINGTAVPSKVNVYQPLELK